MLDSEDDDFKKKLNPIINRLNICIFIIGIIGIIFVFSVPIFYNGENGLKQLRSEINELKNNITKINKVEEENNKLRSEINELKNNITKIKKVEEENKQLKNKIDELKNQINDLNQWKENIESEKLAKLNSIINSKIIEKKEEIKMISNRLTEKDNNYKISFNLIYRATRDGGYSSDYYRLCQNKHPTITLIKTVKGCRFGGYTETIISNKVKGYFPDANSFIFALNKTKVKIYNNKKPKEKIIWHGEDYGPYFNGAFGVNQATDADFFYPNKHEILFSKSQPYYFGTNDEEYEINNGDSIFHIKELEVFEVIKEENL